MLNKNERIERLITALLESRRKSKWSQEPQIDEFIRVAFPEYAKKSVWLLYDLEPAIEMLTNSVKLPDNVEIKYFEMARELSRKSFVKSTTIDWYGNPVFSINKKRAKRFVKQNLNRFLMSVEWHRAPRLNTSI